MRIYFPIAKVDAERREVWGYASTEACDDQGEIVKRDALITALGDYMKFANIREMHQLSAVGVAREAAVDDKGLYVGAKIVDDQAWQKIIEGVYKGYSIGGRVTQRDPADYKTITGLVLNEISLVDRPANPEAVFDYWKAAGTVCMPETRFNPPYQIWACGTPEHRHLVKSDALKCQDKAKVSDIGLITPARTTIATTEGALEKGQGTTGNGSSHDEEYADTGYQADGKRRYPIDTERHIRGAWNFINRPSNAQRYTAAQLDKIKARIIAAWKEKIDETGPPAAENIQNTKINSPDLALTKALWDVGHVARIILDLDWLTDNLAVEAAMEGNAAPQPSRLEVIIGELCGLLSALVVEETDEILNDAELVGVLQEPSASDVLTMAAGDGAAILVADLCRGQSLKMQKFAATILAKAKRSEVDQALLDVAYHAVDKCMGMDGLLFAERSHIAGARDALQAAGALAGEKATVHTAGSPAISPAMVLPPNVDLRPRKNCTVDTSRHLSSGVGEVLEMIATALEKRGHSHQSLMDVAHDCVSKLTNGAICLTAKAGARHSRETLSHLAGAHGHLVAAGAKCDAAGSADQAECKGTEFEPGKVAAEKLSKLLAGERAEKAALIATLTDIVPRLDRLTKRVEDIARTPLPPLTIAKNVTGISKRQDGGGSAFSTGELAAAFSQMSKEEQTLTLIKASYARPLHAPGVATAKERRSE
jgi:phage head maturation protease